MTFANCTWLNEPAQWELSHDVLTVTTDRATDFWRQTHYGFTRDTGHLFGQHVAGDFTAELRVQARFEALYDQAGLMVRIDAERWVKAGIELSDGTPMLSSVLTDDLSDWATAPYQAEPGDFRLRATVKAGVLRLQVSADGRAWPLVRLCPFPVSAGCLVGPMCCTPERAGLVARFSEFLVGPAVDRDLHDLS